MLRYTLNSQLLNEQVRRSMDFGLTSGFQNVWDATDLQRFFSVDFELLSTFVSRATNCASRDSFKTSWTKSSMSATPQLSFLQGTVYMFLWRIVSTQSLSCGVGVIGVSVIVWGKQDFPNEAVINIKVGRRIFLRFLCIVAIDSENTSNISNNAMISAKTSLSIVEFGSCTAIAFAIGSCFHHPRPSEPKENSTEV